MIRSALVMCAGILAAACFACMPAPPPPPVGGAAGPQTCNAGYFVSKVAYVTTPFSPSPGGGPPTTSPFPTNPGTPDYTGDLTSAFNAASLAFQQQLCNLDAVYINAACPSSGSVDCFEGSWGWRQSTNTIGNGRVIALSASLWTGSDSMPKYSTYETNLMQSILPLRNAYYSCLPTTCGSIDNFATTLLAALAHEVGHVRWYDLVDPYYSDPDPTNFCSATTGSFFGQSWVTPVHRPPHWRGLLTPQARNSLRSAKQWPDSHKNAPHVADIDKSSGNPAYAAQLTYGLFAPTAPWASAFAAVSPDEDFVETYKFKVLTTANPPLTSMVLTVPTVGTPSYANVAQDYFNAKNGIDKHKAELLRKVNCIPDTL